MKPRDPLADAASFLALRSKCFSKRAGHVVAALSGEPWGGNLDSPVFKELFVLHEYDDIAAGRGSHARLCRDALLP